MAVAPAQPQPLEGAQQPAQPQPLEGSRPYSAPAAHLEPRYSQLMTMSRCTHVSAYFCTCGRAGGRGSGGVRGEEGRPLSAVSGKVEA